MDSGTGSEPHQFLETELDLSVFLEGERVSECFDQDRQSYSHLLLEPDWELISVSTLPACTGDMELVSCSSGNYSYRVLP